MPNWFEKNYKVSLLLVKVQTLVKRLSFDKFGEQYLLRGKFGVALGYQEDGIIPNEGGEPLHAVGFPLVVALVKQLPFHDLDHIFNVHRLWQQLRHVHYRHQVVYVALDALGHTRILFSQLIETWFRDFIFDLANLLEF